MGLLRSSFSLLFAVHTKPELLFETPDAFLDAYEAGAFTAVTDADFILDPAFFAGNDERAIRLRRTIKVSVTSIRRWKVEYAILVI